MKDVQKMFSVLIAQIIEIIVILLSITVIIIYIFFQEVFFSLLKSAGGLAPIFFAGALYLLITTKRIKKAKKDIEKNGSPRLKEYYCIYVSKQDEMKNDALAFLTALVVVVIAKEMSGDFNYSDIWQAGAAFLAVYLTKKIYFKKQFSFFGKNKEEGLGQ